MKTQKCLEEKCNRNTRTYPYCWQHAELILKVKICKSKWLENNLGLFAFSRNVEEFPRDPEMEKPIFKKNQKIVRYEGEKLTKTELSERYDKTVDGEVTEGLGEYVLEYEHNKFIDASRIRCYTAYINDPNGLVKIPEKANVKFSRKCWIKALRDIYNGEELLISYGNNYWK